MECSWGTTIEVRGSRHLKVMAKNVLSIIDFQTSNFWKFSKFSQLARQICWIWYHSNRPNGFLLRNDNWSAWVPLVQSSGQKDLSDNSIFVLWNIGNSVYWLNYSSSYSINSFGPIWISFVISLDHIICLGIGQFPCNGIIIVWVNSIIIIIVWEWCRDS